MSTPKETGNEANISPHGASSQERPGPASVLCVQRVLPPYRLPFFRRLAESPLVDLTLACGEAKGGSALRSLDPPANAGFLRLRNASLGRRELVTWQRGLLEAVDSERFDAIIAEFNPRIVSNLAALVRARRRGVPFVWWGQGFSRDSSAVAAAVRVRLVRLAAALLVYSRSQAERFVARGVDPARVFVAPNAIDTEAIRRLARPWEEVDRHRILCIGRLVPEKKVDVLVRAFAEVRLRLARRATLTIVGEGPEEAPLRTLVDELDLEDVTQFTGALYAQEDLAPLFNESLVMASPGAAGLSVVHSLAYGVPVLAARGEPHGPEFDLLESDRTVFLCASDDPPDMADALVRLLQDDTSLGEAGRAGLRAIRRDATLTAMVEGFEAVIRSAIVRPRRENLPS